MAENDDLRTTRRPLLPVLHHPEPRERAPNARAAGVPPFCLDDGQDERSAAGLRRRLATARRSLIRTPESRFDVLDDRLAAFAYLTTSLFATSYQVTPDIEYSAPGGET